MGSLATNLMSLASQDVIITTSLNDQLHGRIVSVDDNCLVFQMTDQKKYINVAHIVYVVPKESISQ